MSNEKNEKVEKLLASSHIYQFLSMCLFEPDEKLVEFLNNKDYMNEVRNCLRENGNGKLSESFKCVQDELKNSTLDIMHKEYLCIFGNATVAMDCPPYEMYFTGSHVYQQTQDLADISGFYKAFGLEVSKEDTTNRWDHIAVELEFLHFLTYKIAYAIENHGEKELESCAAGKKKFLKAHIGRWIQAFSKAVDKKASVEFYRQVTKLANVFVHLEMENQGVRAEEIDELQGGEPDYLQRLEGKSASACDSCMEAEEYSEV
jgi:TorA maturation chaperone TorD